MASEELEIENWENVIDDTGLADLHEQFADDFYHHTIPHHDRVFNKQKALMAEIRVLENILKRERKTITPRMRTRYRNAKRLLSRGELATSDKAHFGKYVRDFEKGYYRVLELSEIVRRKKRTLISTSQKLESIQEDLEDSHHRLNLVEHMLSQGPNISFHEVLNHFNTIDLQQEDNGEKIEALYSLIPEEFIDNDWEYLSGRSTEYVETSIRKERRSSYQLRAPTAHEAALYSAIDYGFKSPEAAAEHVFEQHLDSSTTKE